MNILSLAEINAVCALIVSRTENYNPLLHACMQVLYFTGARAGEVANLSLWNMNITGKVEWQTIKRGGIRSVNQSLIPVTFQNAIMNPPQSNFLCSKRNMRSAFDIFSPYQAIYTKDKQISTHLFRHRLMKQLYAEGWSYDDLRTYFAVGANEVPEYYVNSVIFID